MVHYPTQALPANLQQVHAYAVQMQPISQPLRAHPQRRTHVLWRCEGNPLSDVMSRVSRLFLIGVHASSQIVACNDSVGFHPLTGQSNLLVNQTIQPLSAQTVVTDEIPEPSHLNAEPKQKLHKEN
jgi:hypothetical protein